ncbi:hypothetical protein HPB50_018352 [Hyalomma asiaticum]|uniref:Uncharacterized protein n=1 Tax=Hyalomma asiaticum TaxID=266040 RepID=A0ACB7TD08_HYAAI|nr:hypothetical protein HPB50_018352 [Hyalomma asiaticum]
MGGSKFLACTRNASQATNLVVAEGFRLNHERVAIEAVGLPVTYVNVYCLPAYVPDDTLTHALQQYGKVRSDNFATVANRQNKLSGVRVVKMEMSRPVPNFTTIQGHRIMFEYRGMRRVCARCGEDGHMATACSSPYCKRCGTFGHETEGCEEVCKRCGGAHGTRECFRRRCYVAAACGFPSINDNAPNREQAKEHSSPKAVASTSGFQLLKPRSTPAAKRAPSYWDGERADESDATGTAPVLATSREDTRESEGDTPSAATDSENTGSGESETSSAQSSPKHRPHNTRVVKSSRYPHLQGF